MRIAPSDEKKAPCERAKPYRKLAPSLPHPPAPLPADQPLGKRTGNTVPEGATIASTSSSSYSTLSPNTHILGTSNVSHTKLRDGSTITSSTVSHCTLEKSHICCGAQVSHSTLKNALICGGNVRHTKLQESNVMGCDFGHCKIATSDLRGEKWTHEKVEGQISPTSIGGDRALDGLEHVADREKTSSEETTPTGLPPSYTVATGHLAKS